MWNDVSKEAFHRTFTRRLTQALEDVQTMRDDEAAPDSTNKNYDEMDIPICCVCDGISLECTPLPPPCSHPACPKCVAMAKLDAAGVTTVMCRTCAQQEPEQDSAVSSTETSSHTIPPAAVKTKREGGPGNETSAVSDQQQAVTRQEKYEAKELSNSGQEDPNLHEAGESAREGTFKQAGNPTAANSQSQAQVQCNFANPVQPVSADEAAALSGRRFPVDPAMAGLIKAYLEEEKSGSTLAERVGKIREAMTLATKYSHCTSCLQAKKCQSPDLLCLDCALSFCTRCSGRHKCSPSSSEHIMIPVEGRRQNSMKANLRGLFCPRHNGSELAMYCRNCEMLVCRECVVDQHLHCPGMVSAQQFASEEREAMKMLHTTHEQVVSFFSEQRRNTTESTTTLNAKKRDFQGQVRKFFSTLIKACMEVEGTLLEELETSVSDHIDLLEEQSSDWLKLQECTQQLLDITDMLHFLPTADFLPLSLASKASLSQALRDGETLAAAAPPHMTLGLCLEESSQRSVVKRIQEIGVTALTVTTHNTLTLRKVTSSTFSAPSDKKEPQVTDMVLLTQTILVAADFNNSCLKLLHRKEGGEEWSVAQVLTLKWRPYSIALLSFNGNRNSSPPQQSGTSGGPHSLPPEVSTHTVDATTSQENQNLANSTPSSGSPRSRGFPLARQSAVTIDDEELASPGDAVDSVLEMQVAVTAPSYGCFVVAVPVSGSEKRKMKVTTRLISEEKGYWGIAVVDDHTIAASTVDAGRCFISLLETDKNFKRLLPLTSSSFSTPLLSPRHITATSPTTMLVCDHGKKAVIHVSTEGSVLFVYTGHGNQRLARPEGLCMDSHGHVYIADSGDNSVSVLTKGGALYSKTGSQQNELMCPLAVCVDRNGCMYISNDGGKLLTVFDIIQKD